MNILISLTRDHRNSSRLRAGAGAGDGVGVEEALKEKTISKIYQKGGGSVLRLCVCLFF